MNTPPTTPQPVLEFHARRPLVPAEVVMVLLDCNDQGIASLIERGDLRWAFNIACPDATRRELRILRESVLEYLPVHFNATPGIACRELRHNQTGPALDDIVRSILPVPTRRRGVSTIRAAELARRLCCSPGLITKLIESKELVLAFRRVGRASALLRYDGVITFLKRRVCERYVPKVSSDEPPQEEKAAA